jgi:hypothetical protein
MLRSAVRPIGEALKMPPVGLWRWIALQNIERFRGLIDSEEVEARRIVLKDLLDREAAKLQEPAPDWR